MPKPTTRDVKLHVSHVEQALALYLKPYFPEVVEIQGVDVNIPMSDDNGSFSLRVYLAHPKLKADNDNENTAEIIHIEEAREEREEAETKEQSK